ncbi:MAG: trypsin-like peptidase domain-containing protein [Clostridia bacterium]|nr:trypsin-like peptidase domain-containing protein [Clostridia bacterium]
MLDYEKELENELTPEDTATAEQPEQTEKTAKADVTPEIPEAEADTADADKAPEISEPAEAPVDAAPVIETPVQQPAAEPVYTVPTNEVPAQQPAAPVQDGPTAYYYAPPQYAAPQYAPPYGYPPVQRKKKMPVGLKVLIIVMCILFGIALFGFIGYGAYSAVTNLVSGFGEQFDIISPPDGFEMLPDQGKDKEDKGNKDDKDSGDKNNDSADTGTNEIVVPDIDVVPNTEGISLHDTPNTPEMDISDVYDKVIRSTVLVLVTAENGNGSGTGIIATEDGYIITNSHVVLNRRNVQVEVKMDDGSLHDAVVVGFDKTTDLAVLKIEGSGYTPAEFADSDNLRMGQWVIAIGNPGGEQFSGSITRGVISGLNRSVGSYSSNGMTYIQTDAAINPGNSGGPLVNLHGQVVGINSAKIVSDQYEGMGFAIPTTGAKTIIDDLLAGGYVQGRVRFGIRGTEINAMQAYTSQVPYGFMISEIDPDSCFVGTEVEPYDIITAVDGVETPTLDALSNALLSYAPGDTATVTLFRPSETGPGGEEFTVEVELLADLGETQN